MADETSILHKHPVVDDDPHFVIDPDTRKIVSMHDVDPVLIQYDHDSERFTFEVPAEIDGHDMMLCDKVEVHYINIDAANLDNVSASRYEVDDLKPKSDDPTKLTFSWLIDMHATDYVGPLNFAVRFRCTAASDEGVVDTYRWNTKPYVGIMVSDGLDTQMQMTDGYADVIDQWENSIKGYGETYSEVVENTYRTAMSNINSTVSNAVNNSVNDAKQDIDEYFEEVKVNITPEALSIADILTQSQGDDTDKVMSQKAVSDALNSLDTELYHTHVTLESQIDAKTSEIDETVNRRVSAMETALKNLDTASLKKYAEIEPDNNGRVYTDIGRVYYLRNDGNTSVGAFKCTVRYRYYLTNGDTPYNGEIRKCSFTGNDLLKDDAELSKYETYHEFRIRNVYAEARYDPSGYVRLAVAQSGKTSQIEHLLNTTSGKITLDGVLADLTGLEYDTYTGSSLPSGTVVRTLLVTDQSTCGLDSGYYNVYTRTNEDGKTEYYLLKRIDYYITLTIVYEVDGQRFVRTYDNLISGTVRTNEVDNYRQWISGYYYPADGYPKVVMPGEQTDLVTESVFQPWVTHIDSAYCTYSDEPWNTATVMYTFNANGISEIYAVGGGPEGVTYRIVFTNGTTFDYDVRDGKNGTDGKDGNGIASIEKTGKDGNDDIYTITLTDGTSNTITVPNTEANRSYIEDNVDDIRTILDQFGATSTESVSELAGVIDVPERVSKYAKLNSFGGMTGETVVPIAQGSNLLPFPYANGEMGSDGEGTLSFSGTLNEKIELINEDNPLVVTHHGHYKFVSGNSAAYINVNVNGILHTGVGSLVLEDLKYGDQITLFAISDDGGTGVTWTAKPAIYASTPSYIDEESGQYVYTGFADEWPSYTGWIPRVASYKFHNIKLQAIKSVGANLITYPYKNSPGVTVSGITYTDTGDGGLHCIGTATASSYFCLSGGFNYQAPVPSWLVPGKQYTIFGGTSNKDVLVQLFLYNTDGSTVVFADTTFVMPGGAAYYGIFVQTRTGKTVDVTIYPMLTTGDEVLPWEPYVEHIYNIPESTPTPDGFVAEDGTLCQDVVDLQNQTYTPNVDTIVFTGDEGWSLYGGRTANVFSIFTKVIRKGICNEYVSTTNTANFGVKNCIYMAHSSRIIVSDLDCTTAMDFIAKLNSRNASGNPVTIKCVRLEEPEAQPLPVKMDKLIPVEPNGHLIAVTDTGEEVPLDVKFTTVGPNINDVLDGINATLELLLNGG